MPRSSSDVIDQAIRENRPWEILASAFALTFIICGILLLNWAIRHNQPIVTVVGVVESSLFWPAMNSAIKTRKANIMLRLLVVPLEQSKSGAEAAEMLQRVFESHFMEKNVTPRRRRVGKIV